MKKIQNFFVDMVKRGENSPNTAFIKLKLANKSVKLDTGAEISVMPMKVFKTFQQVELKPTAVRLMSYTGQQLDVAGQAEFECSHKGKQSKLKFVVVKTNAVPILGFISCQEVNLIKVILAVDTVKPEEEYQDVFKGIGLFPGEYHIKINDNVSPLGNPQFHKLYTRGMCYQLGHSSRWHVMWTIYYISAYVR